MNCIPLIKDGFGKHFSPETSKTLIDFLLELNNKLKIIIQQFNHTFYN